MGGREIRVLFVESSVESASDSPAGGEMHLITMADSLRERGGFRCYSTYPAEGGFSKLLREHGIEPVFMPTRRLMGLAAVAPLARFLAEERIDIVHAYDVRSYLPSMLARKRAGTKGGVLIYHLPYLPRARRHSWRMRQLRWGQGQRDRLAAQMADAIVVISDEIEDELAGVFGFPREKLVKIYNGIDGRIFRPSGLRDEGRRSLDLLPHEPVVGMVARFVPQKGHRVLLEAFELLLRRMPQAKLVLAGSGPTEEEVRGEAAMRGLSENIVFAGFQRNVLPIYEAMDVLALPSVDEGMNLTVLEAMFMGKPVVASDIPALSAVIRDGRTGFLFKPGDAAGLAAHLERLLRDRDLARRMGDAGRELAESEYDLDTMVAKTIGVYERVLAVELPG